jgi:predicted amidohydrolase
MIIKDLREIIQRVYSHLHETWEYQQIKKLIMIFPEGQICIEDICAKARAIENECYVAIAGSVGNLPKVRNMDIQYAQSAVFSPSDFAFPNNAIIAESTANTEMAIIADVDLDLLKELHTLGSVRNLKDRRTDLYEVKWKKLI